MIIPEPGGRAVPPTSVISISGPSPSGQYYSAPRGYSMDVEQEKTLEELKADWASAHRNRRGAWDNEANRKYYENLVYMSDHGPMTRTEKEAKEFGTDDILDAIFYASALASVIPFPATKIGGSIGMGATGVARAYYSGNRQERYRSTRDFARTIDRSWRYYQSYRRRVA